MTGIVDVPRRRQYLAGEWTGAADDEWFDDLDPFTGQVFARIPASTRVDAQRAVNAAAAAFPSWSATGPRERQQMFLRAADIVEQRGPELIALLAAETGAVFKFAAFQVQWSAGFLRQAAHWPYDLGGEIIALEAPDTTCYAFRQPLGVVAGFTPWNGAFNLAWRTVAPPLACGNTVVLKPSEEAPVAAGLVIAEILEQAGFPAGVCSVITHAGGGAVAIADEFFDRPEVRAINFTGSTVVGRHLAERSAHHLKKIVLELGGFNPMIVLADADMENAVETAAFAAFFHQGQICMNARKIIVEAPLYDEFLDRLATKARTLTVGDPRDRASALGPLINAAAVEKARSRLAGAQEHGATVVAGGRFHGPCLEPTILVGVQPGSPLDCEETFAPMVIVERVDDVAAALAVANGTSYGLTASIMCGDTGRGLELAKKVEAGVVNVNSPTMYAEPVLPIGGVKDSGWGRFGRWSVENFTERHVVTVNTGAARLRI
ncbi:MAG: aldehyde dehydrogenase family protein [Candidatus Dormibacteraeota bacterium]|nr:aldehyde dehydrogenase family protein [Candidatus Dormibacteraeota bacterium]